jgi:hypothetical protein
MYRLKIIVERGRTQRNLFPSSLPSGNSIIDTLEAGDPGVPIRFAYRDEKGSARAGGDVAHGRCEAFRSISAPDIPASPRRPCAINITPPHMARSTDFRSVCSPQLGELGMLDLADSQTGRTTHRALRILPD